MSEIRRYLLGQLGEKGREPIESRLFEDPSFLASVEAEENELIDAYVAGELSVADRRAWESYRASRPEVVQREEFARALRTRFASPPPFRRQWWQWAAAFAAVALVLAVFWLQPSKSFTLMAVTLKPGTLRSSESAQIVAVPKGITQLRLQFPSAGAARVRLRSVDTGGEIWSGPLSGGAAQLPVPPPGDYVATVASATGEELDDYTFRIAPAPPLR